MRQHSTLYIFGFAAAVCVVCALLVAGSAVLLRERQEANRQLDRQKKVLAVAGLLGSDERLTDVQIRQRFDTAIRPVVIDLATGREVDAAAASRFDPSKVATIPAPPNGAGVRSLPVQAMLYQVVEEGGRVRLLILPVEGKGLWSTMYGFIALEADGNTVAGLTFYQHGETPGLGGEIENPAWLARWPGRRVFDAQGQPKLTVKKGAAGRPEEDPHHVDGISGATLTCRGVGSLLQFWFGKEAFGPYLDSFRAGR